MISLENITKVYKGAQTSFDALRNVSLQVRKGEFVSIMGRSGCGKTTLLNILGCIDSFTGGSYRFADTDIGKLTPEQLAKIRRERIGYVFQAFNLIEELTCAENVALTLGYLKVGKQARHARAMELLESVDLAEKAKQFPAQLSGGQKQRVAIARALSNNPMLILADEPTGNLDYANGLDIMNLLSGLNEKGTTVVMVTHDDAFSRFASRTLHMADGEILD